MHRHIHAQGYVAIFLHAFHAYALKKHSTAKTPYQFPSCYFAQVHEAVSRPTNVLASCPDKQE